MVSNDIEEVSSSSEWSRVDYFSQANKSMLTTRLADRDDRPFESEQTDS